MKTVKELENILNDPNTSEQDYREADAELFDKVVEEMKDLPVYDPFLGIYY